MSTETYSKSEIAQFKALQRLAYDCAQEIAAGLVAGVTEIEAASALGSLMRERGAQGFFHTPFAWFGDRAGFHGFTRPSWRRPLDNVFFARQFFPTERRLKVGDTAILDVAPIRDGICADIGYAFALGHNVELERTMGQLRELRTLILDEIRRERTMREVYRLVDRAIRDMGLEAAHVVYPSSVLGHKIGRIPLEVTRAPSAFGFDLRTYLYFGRQILDALPGKSRVPLWNESRFADVRPDPGLWAIEPHVRASGIGAKWEEILVVDSSDAYWLDDDLPHVRATSAEPRVPVSA